MSCRAPVERTHQFPDAKLAFSNSRCNEPASGQRAGKPDDVIAAQGVESCLKPAIQVQVQVCYAYSPMARHWSGPVTSDGVFTPFRFRSQQKEYAPMGKGNNSQKNDKKNKKPKKDAKQSQAKGTGKN